MSKPENPPLFKSQFTVGGRLTEVETEVTLRDLFAGMVAAGELSRGKTETRDDALKLAKGAYWLADALLAEREK